MATQVIMPKVDMVMETGTFVEWLAEEGEQVVKGEPLFVILTDKASIEIEAPGSGVLAGSTVQPDDVVPVSEVIAYILEPGEELPTEAASAPAAAPEPVPPAAQVAAPQAEPVPTPSTDGKVRATPVARRLAAELGIDLGTLTGRGPHGRIQKADVLAAAESGVAVPLAVQAAAAPVSALTLPLPVQNDDLLLFLRDGVGLHGSGLLAQFGRAEPEHRGGINRQLDTAACRINLETFYTGWIPQHDVAFQQIGCQGKGLCLGSIGIV